MVSSHRTLGNFVARVKANQMMLFKRGMDMATDKNTKGKARNGGSHARAWHNGLEPLESRVLFSAAPLVAELAGSESADGGAAAIEFALVPGDTHPMPVPELRKEALPVDQGSDKVIDPSDCPQIADLIGCPGQPDLEHGPGMHDSEIWATEIGSSYIQKGDSGGPSGTKGNYKAGFTTGGYFIPGSDAVADPSTEDFWVALSPPGNLHDSVHCLVGGTMCSARSSSDPIVAGEGPNGEFAIQAASDGVNNTQRSYLDTDAQRDGWVIVGNPSLNAQSVTQNGGTHGMDSNTEIVEITLDAGGEKLNNLNDSDIGGDTYEQHADSINQGGDWSTNATLSGVLESAIFVDVTPSYSSGDLEDQDPLNPQWIPGS
jgi:hypothetical protein